MAGEKPPSPEPNRGFLEDIDRLKDRLVRGRIDPDEVLELVEALEGRIALLEGDNRSFRSFFDNLVQVLGDNLRREEIRELIRQIALREILLKSDESGTGAVH